LIGSCGLAKQKKTWTFSQDELIAKIAATTELARTLSGEERRQQGRG
jgi:hypothetical protein